MKFGIVFPQTEIGNDPIAIRDYAQTVEGLGFDHLLAYDHVLGANPGSGDDDAVHPPLFELARQFGRCPDLPLVRVHGIEQAHGNASRGAEPRSFAGDIAHRRDLDAVRDPRFAQALADEFVLHLVDCIDHLRARITDADLSVEALLDDHIDILVDRGGDHGPGLGLVELPQIGSPAGEADS